MEDTNTVTMTALDSAVADNHLQMMKAAIPYINMSEQKFLAIYAKIQELKNTITFFQNSTKNDLGACSLESDSKDPLDMLNDMRSYGNEQEQESIDMIMNFLNAFQLYNTYKETMANSEEDGEGSGDSFSMLKAILPPEQQSMFDTYSMLFNNMNT